MKIKIISLIFLALFFISPVLAADPACSFCEFINISKGDPGATGPTGPANMTMNLTANMTAGPEGPTGPANMTAGPKGDTGLTGPANMTMNLTANMTSGPANMTMNLTANMTMNLTSVDTTSFLFLNGSRIMSGIFNGGKYNISNITTFLDTDAVNRSYVIAVNTSMKAYVDALPSGGDTSPFIFLNGSRWMTGYLNMSKFNVSNITTTAGGDAINLTLTTSMNSSMRNNISEYVIAVNNSMRQNVSAYILAVNETIKNNMTSGVGSMNQTPNMTAGFAYTLQGHSLIQATTTDSAIYIFGGNGKAPNVTIGNSSRIYFPKPGNITMAEVYVATSGTAGSNEGWACYLINNTFSVGKTNFIENLSSALGQRRWTNSSMSIPAKSGDWVEFKCLSPAWATNPTNIYFSGTVYIGP